MENNNRKQYTFIATNKCVGKNGSNFNDVTAVLTLFNIEGKVTSNGKKVVTARAAINNRTSLLNSALGCNLTDENGVLWTDISVWEDRAERFEKYIGNRTKMRLCVVGTISVRKFTKKDGKESEALTINVNDWFGMDRAGSDNSAGAASEAPEMPQTNNIPTVGDDDLPF